MSRQRRAVLFANTVVSFLDQFGLLEQGEDLGGLTVEMFSSFWTELLRGWLHTQLSTDEKRKWPWILPNNVELSPPVLQILFAN